jgi:hypothetical protein
MKRFSYMFVLGAAVILAARPVAAQDNAAEQYAKAAHAHSMMARAYIGNPNHPMDANMANHCRQLARLANSNAERAMTNAVAGKAVVPAPPPRVRVGKTPSPSH